MATRSENEFRDLGNNSGHVPIKLPDRSVCQTCGTVIFKQHLFWPDYILPTAGHLVEVKEAKEYFPFGNLSDEQRDRLDWWHVYRLKDTFSWVFLELGDGSAPKGRSAYMISWPRYKEAEAKLLASGQKSIGKETKRNPGADDVFAESRMDWIPGIGWFPPEGHPWRHHMQ